MSRSRARVVIAGAGIAGLEAALALRRHAPGMVDVELIDPSPEFVYRPMLVAEPFGVEAAMRFELEALAEHTGARLRKDSVTAVDAVERIVTTAGGAEIPYDDFLLASGARPVECVPGAITFGSPASVAAFGNLLARLDHHGWVRIAFVVPKVTTWTIAAYELALLTAAECAARDLSGMEIALVTYERAPLEAFGREGSELVRSRLAEAGIDFHPQTDVTEHRDGQLLVAGGAAIPCDHAVALPRLEVEEIAGLPHGLHGFLPTDVQMHVAGLERVWAAGDATRFPIKQGGLAAQQADVAARGIAVRAGSPVPAEPFRPILRALLITGGAPEFLRSHRADGESSHSQEPLWWPPEKLAARYLGPLLAAESDGIEFSELIDLEPPDDPVAADAESQKAIHLLLGGADADASAGELTSALALLALAEKLELVLPPEYVARRDRWRQELDPGTAPSAAGARIDPNLISAADALSDLEHRIGRLRAIEKSTGGDMGRDLSHLDEGIRQLRVLSAETELLDSNE